MTVSPSDQTNPTPPTLGPLEYAAAPTNRTRAACAPAVLTYGLALLFTILSINALNGTPPPEGINALVTFAYVAVSAMGFLISFLFARPRAFEQKWPVPLAAVIAALTTLGVWWVISPMSYQLGEWLGESMLSNIVWTVMIALAIAMGASLVTLSVFRRVTGVRYALTHQN
ncbi:MAG TPA: hypothetical protein VIM11_11585 [Tepidisphaeraceae bacterium]